jgi:phosphatidylinositol alpha-1,6-mannosyltransferase
MILITTQNFPPAVGGIEILMAGLARTLSAAGEDVWVFADGRSDGTAEPYRVSRYGGPKPIRRWLKARDVARAARTPGVTGVFADSWKSLEALGPLPVPIVMLAHGAEWPTDPSPSKRRRIELALAKASRILAVSDYTASRVRLYAPTAGDRIAIVHPPISPQPTPSAEAARRIAALCRTAGPLVASLARLEPRKGFDMTLRAVADLAADHPNLTYAIGGGGDDLARLQALVASLGIADRVHFLGRVDEDQKAALLAGADLFVMPTRQVGRSVEGFGIIYLEAAWHGLAAIAGTEGGGGDAVLDGVTGLVVDGADQAAVTGALRRLIEEPAERAAMGQAAAARVRRDFLWDHAAPRFLAALKP